MKLSNGNEDKEVSFNINVTNPAEAYFEFQRVDAYFNESGEASVYDKGDSWDNTSNIVFNLSKLFKNVDASDNKFTFEEVIPELKASNATAWLQSGSDKISIGQYKLQETKNGGRGLMSTYDGTFLWKADEPENYSAKANGENTLVINGSMGMMTVTYVEKDGTLLIGKQVYTKEKDGDMQKFKEAEQKRLQALYDADDMGFYNKRFLTSLNFADATADKK